jgi:1-acyl-sn-glycerol-3-phosphate acyltransferase
MLGIILRLILFPIKFILFFTAHILLLLPKHLFQYVYPLGLKIILFCLGYNIQDIVDKRSNKNTKSPIIVYQHNTFADGYILLHTFGPTSFVVLEKHLVNPIIKRFTKNFGCIPVNDKKKGASQEIRDYIQKGDYTYPLAIAPEGGKIIYPDNDDTILASFSTGAFVPLAPVQPVLIDFGFEADVDDPRWNYVDGNDKVVSWFMWRFLAKPCNITVTLLEECHATEGQTPKEYCEDVRTYMRNEILGIDNTDILSINKQDNTLQVENTVHSETTLPVETTDINHHTDIDTRSQIDLEMEEVPIKSQKEFKDESIKNDINDTTR